MTAEVIQMQLTVALNEAATHVGVDPVKALRLIDKLVENPEVATRILQARILESERRRNAKNRKKGAF